MPVAIRDVQHYLYCAHRWGLIEIGKVWSENYFVTKSNIMHTRVHGDSRYTSRGRKVLTSVPVYNPLPEYDIFGYTDCLEIPQGADLKDLAQRDGIKITIVEYKPKKPKAREYNFDDLMQVFAQKICVDYMFGGDADGILYYSDQKERVKLPLKENFAEYDALLKKILAEMREFMKEGTIPPIKKDQYCFGCSMKDICMPKLKVPQSFRDLVKTVED